MIKLTPMQRMSLFLHYGNRPTGLLRDASVRLKIMKKIEISEAQQREWFTVEQVMGPNGQPALRYVPTIKGVEADVLECDFNAQQRQDIIQYLETSDKFLPSDAVWADDLLDQLKAAKD